jgi:hypothetical protein
MDTGSVRKIMGVVTQPRGDENQMVTSYTVSVSDDNLTWKDVDGGVTFTGNVVGSDRNVKVQNEFAAAVQARYVRINVVSWDGHLSMRAGVYLEGPTC